MITVAQAKHIILKNTQNFGVAHIPFLKSMGKILKEDIFSDRDLPPFNRVSMDGVAINFTHFKNGQRNFKVEGIQAAGSKQLSMQNSKNCIEVMTGAILPNNCDTVIRYEDIILENGIATININTVNYNQNVHLKGKDKKAGDLLITQNTKITAAEIGILATVGKNIVTVAKQPKVIIISTGDELVEVDKIPETHQIRKSNVFTLVSLLEQLHISSKTDHITDNKSILKSKLKTYLQEFDVLLCSGAVSKGKFDFLPEVLQELGVQKLFHKVAQRPGKPFWMGKTNHCKVFAFPGNPISTFVNCVKYFYPWYYKSVKVKTKEETVILAENVYFKPNLTYFLQVQIKNKNGQLYAFPMKGNGSGDLASLVLTDGFIELPKTEEIMFKKGSIFPLILYRK